MKITIRLIAALICFPLCQAVVHAATNYWDIDGATAGAGGVTPAGIWDTGATANWSTDSAGGAASATWSDTADAIFSAGTDATGTFAVAVSGAPVVGNLTAEEGTITISGGTALNVGGGVALKGVIDVFANSTLAISSVITGGDDTGSITKGISGGTGTGTLVLSGANTFNGQVTVRVGILSFDSIGNGNGGPSALGNPTNASLGTIKVGGGTVAGTLQYTGTGHSTDRVINMAGTTGGATNDASGSGAIIFTSPTGVTATANGVKMFTLTGTSTADNTIMGSIVNPASGYIRMEKSGAGTWVLNGNNTFSGVFDIRDGTLVVNSLANKGTACSMGTGDAGNGHDIIGLGGRGSTIATLKYTGAGHSSSRPIYLWGLTTGGGTIDASGTGPLVLRGEIRRPGNETAAEIKVLTLKGTNTGTNTISNQISDAVTGGKTSVTKEGVGKWVLSGPNAYTGATTVNEGTLWVNGLGSLAAGSAVSVNSAATLGGKGTINGPVKVNGGKLSPGASAGTLTLANGLDMTDGGIMVWELAALKDDSDGFAGADFDQVSLIGGSLELAGSPAQWSSAVSIHFIGSATAPDASVAFWQSPHTWTIIALTAPATNPSSSHFISVANGSYAAGNFTKSVDGSGNVRLIFTPAAGGAPRPMIVSVTGAGTTNVTVTWSNAVANTNYVLQFNTNLTATNWTSLSPVTATGTTASRTDNPPAGDLQRHYRVLVQ